MIFVTSQGSIYYEVFTWATASKTCKKNIQYRQLNLSNISTSDPRFYFKDNQSTHITLQNLCNPYPLVWKTCIILRGVNDLLMSPSLVSRNPHHIILFFTLPLSRHSEITHQSIFVFVVMVLLIFRWDTFYI